MANEISLETLMKNKEVQQSIETTKEAELAKVTKEVETLTPQQRERVEEIKNSIDLMDSQNTLSFGVGAQKNIAAFSETILSQIKSKDAGEVGNIMSDLMIKVKNADIAGEDGNFLSKIPFLNKLAHSTEKYLARYQNLETQIDRIEGELDKSRLGLLKDIGMMDNLYQKNLEYFNELEVYIKAGEEKLVELKEETLPKLRKDAAESNEPMAVQLVNDFEQTVNRFEKKVHDLKLSKTLAIQTAPQIKLIQNNDKLLVDKIQTAILNTIPLWKSQVVISLGLSKQKSALQMQKDVSETTNELLKKNSEMLKTNTIDVARESEKGIIELDTLKKVNDDLITTIDETLKIQKEGQARRLQAEQELLKIEDTLKQSLLKAVGAGPAIKQNAADEDMSLTRKSLDMYDGEKKN